MTPGTVVIGYDIRPTSPELAAALTQGLRDEGVDVIDIGLCGTEEVYFATTHLNAGGGLMVTASHNPIDYNGIKMVREGSRPISAADGLSCASMTRSATSKSKAATPNRTHATPMRSW